MQSRTSRIALILFAVYLVLYSGFVFLNAFAPWTMEVTPVARVNLAILYGFGLIVAAFLLALLYGWLVVDPIQAAPSTSGSGSGPTGSDRAPSAAAGDPGDSTEGRP
jgi:uncharacterized membrane protein (DUF485 family)